MIERGTRMQRFWADLTGMSDRWGRTILYSAVFARLSLLPAAALVLLLYGAATGDWTGSESVEGFSGAVDDIDGATIISALVIAPLFETLLLALLVWVLGFWLKARRWLTVTVVALAFVPLHGLAIGSLFVLPFFILMATVWYNWKRRGDGFGGYWVVMTMHLVSNGLTLITTAAFGSLDSR